MFNYFSDLINNSSGFWTMMQFFAIVLSLYFIYRQLHAQEATLQNQLSSMKNQLKSQDVTTCNILWKKWDSKQMAESRNNICSNYGTEDTVEVKHSKDRVSSYFESIGFYVEEEMLGITITWNHYSHHIEHYWYILKDHIELIRQERQDDTYFENFEKLYGHIIQYKEDKKLYSGLVSKNSIETFCNSELKATGQVLT